MLEGRRTGDAQVGLPGSVHDARIDGGSRSGAWVNMRLSELAGIRGRFSLEGVLEMWFAQAAAGVGRGCRVEEAVRRRSRPCAVTRPSAAGARDTARGCATQEQTTLWIQFFAAAAARLQSTAVMGGGCVLRAASTSGSCTGGGVPPFTAGRGFSASSHHVNQQSQSRTNQHYA